MATNKPREEEMGDKRQNRFHPSPAGLFTKGAEIIARTLAEYLLKREVTDDIDATGGERQ